MAKAFWDTTEVVAVKAAVSTIKRTGSAFAELMVKVVTLAVLNGIVIAYAVRAILDWMYY